VTPLPVVAVQTCGLANRFARKLVGLRTRQCFIVLGSP